MAMRRKSNAAAILVLLASVAAPAARAQEIPTPQRIAEVRKYIKEGWTTLTRSVRDLPKAAPDPKMKEHRGPWTVYFSVREDPRRLEAEIARQLDAAGRAQIALRPLPPQGAKLTEHGLLYL